MGEPSGGCGGWSEARGKGFGNTSAFWGGGTSGWDHALAFWRALVLRENKRRTLSPHHNEAEIRLQLHDEAKGAQVLAEANALKRYPTITTGLRALEGRGLPTMLRSLGFDRERVRLLGSEGVVFLPKEVKKAGLPSYRCYAERHLGRISRRLGKESKGPAWVG